MNGLNELRAKLLVRIRSTQVLSDSLLVLMPSTAGVLTTLASIPLLTRMYTPGAMGISAGVMAISMIVGIVVTLGVPATLPSTSRSTRAITAAGVLLFASTTLATFIACAIALVPDELVAWTTAGQESHEWWIAFAALAIGANDTATYLNVRERSYAAIGYSQLCLHLVRAAVQLGAGVGNFGWEGLILGEIAGRVAATTTLLISLRAKIGEAIANADGAELRATMQEVAFGPRTILPTSLFDIAISSIPVLGLNAFYGPTVAGHFALVMRIIEGPSGLAIRLITNVFHGEFAERMRKGGAGIRSLAMKSFLGLLVVVGVPVLAVCPVAPELFSFIFGEHWRPAGEGFTIFAAPAVLMAATGPATRVLFVTRQVWRKMYVFGVFGIGYCVALTLAVQLKQPFEIAWIGLAAASSIGYLTYFSASLAAAKLQSPDSP